MKSDIFAFFRKKIVVLSIVAVPLTSVGAGMTIYIDNLAGTLGEPIIMQDSVINLDEDIIVNFTESIYNTQKYCIIYF